MLNISFAEVWMKISASTNKLAILLNLDVWFDLVLALVHPRFGFPASLATVAHCIFGKLETLLTDLGCITLKLAEPVPMQWTGSQ